MGFKSVLGKIGKVALTAAPYVAAPFTGGASLAATGLTQAAVKKWASSDAKKAEAKGLAPSKFDKVLGKVGDYASMGSMVMPTGALAGIGMLGKGAKAAQVAAKAGTAAKVAGTASKIGKVASIGNKIKTAADIAIPAIGAIGAIKGARSGGAMNDAQYGNDLPSQGGITGRSGGRGIAPSTMPGQSNQTARGRNEVMPRGGFKYNDNPLNQYDQTTPNLAEALHQGRQEAIRNQPFRGGYDSHMMVGDEKFTSKMPAISSGFGGNNRKRRNQQQEVGM